MASIYFKLKGINFIYRAENNPKIAIGYKTTREKGGKHMADKRNKAACGADKKTKPSAANDQLGENAGEGRFQKHVSSKGGKNH